MAGVFHLFGAQEAPFFVSVFKEKPDACPKVGWYKYKIDKPGKVANKKQTHELRSKGYRDITFFYYYKSDYGIYYTHKERYRYYL